MLFLQLDKLEHINWNEILVVREPGDSGVYKYYAYARMPSDDCGIPRYYDCSTGDVTLQPVLGGQLLELCISPGDVVYSLVSQPVLAKPLSRVSLWYKYAFEVINILHYSNYTPF